MIVTEIEFPFTNIASLITLKQIILQLVFICQIADTAESEEVIKIKQSNNYYSYRS